MTCVLQCLCFSSNVTEDCASNTQKKLLDSVKRGNLKKVYMGQVLSTRKWQQPLVTRMHGCEAIITLGQYFLKVFLVGAKFHPSLILYNYVWPTLLCIIILLLSLSSHQVKDFHSKGANLMEADQNGWTLLHHAARLDKVEVVQYIVKNSESCASTWDMRPYAWT